MATAPAVVTGGKPIAWWKEPSRDQWYAWWAAWLGWTLDGFDFTVYLLIIVPVSKEFHVSLTAATLVLTLTLWMRLVGATASGWLADRIGRKTPLMISIAWYSIANFVAGFSPTFWFLFVCRALLGIGMGAEWPVGAALVLENWPIRSRGLMSGILQGSGNLGFLLASVVYGLFYNYIGWRGMLWIGILPALTIVYIRFFVKESPIWLENRRQQRAEGREMKVPLLAIFKRGILGNTLGACWVLLSSFICAYSIWTLFAAHLQADLHMSPARLATPIALANLFAFLAASSWGWLADRIGRRWAMILPAVLAIVVAPFYLFTANFAVLVVAFIMQGMAGGGGMWGPLPGYLNERFPTEVRATAAGFCYHQGAIFGGFVGPVLTFLAGTWGTGLALPMFIGTALGAGSFIIALLLGPETRGKELVPDLVLA
jgi:SHS family lactate transporter-like MFS transporter